MWESHNPTPYGTYRLLQFYNQFKLLKRKTKRALLIFWNYFLVYRCPTPETSVIIIFMSLNLMVSTWCKLCGQTDLQKVDVLSQKADNLGKQQTLIKSDQSHTLWGYTITHKCWTVMDSRLSAWQPAYSWLSYSKVNVLTMAWQYIKSNKVTGWGGTYYTHKDPWYR